MRTHPSPVPEREHVAGLVDGLITLSRDIVGSLSIHVTLGSTGAEARPDGAIIEIGLSSDMASQLSRLLLADDGNALHLPCHVGLRA